MMASAPRPPELDGRTAAALAVTDALAGRRFVSDALREWRAAGRLSGREAGLAREIGLGAVRHVVTIEHVLGALAGFDRRRVKPKLRAILGTAAYQIIWMDRIPAFAAVDQAVELARRLVRGRAPAMVNAVLRRLTGAIAERRVPWRRLETTQIRVAWDAACQFNVPVLPDPSEGEHAAAHLAAATGERAERYRTLVARHGPAQAEAVASASQAVPATVLHRNTLRSTAETFEREIRTDFADLAEVVGDVAFLAPSADVLDAQSFRAGGAFVQDTTAHAAALAVAAHAGERILDLCAAPGGKSIVLALQMNDSGDVIACDTVPERLARVDDNARRLGLTCIHTRTLADAQPDLGSEAFNAALVDVPCSNTGVIARRPEARLGLTPRKLQSLVETQRGLLRLAAQHVRPGGRLVYSTCSIEPEENEQLVAQFLSENAAWRLDRQETMLPTWGLNWSDWRDGGYFARLSRC